VSKKSTGIALILLSVFVALVGCDSLQPEVRWESYENRFIKMDYPAEWTYEEVESEVMIAMRFVDEEEEFVFEMSITGIENWMEEEEKLEMMEEVAIEQSREEGFEILENEAIEIDGYPGFKIVDQQEDRGTRQTIATVFHYQQLAINFAGTDEAYNEQVEIVNEMVDSIEVIVK